MVADVVSGILQRALAGYTEDYKYHAADGRIYIQWGKVEHDIRATIAGSEMPDELTTTEAAAYLAFAGYTVKSRRDGTTQPPSAGTIKQWLERGKLTGRKRDNRWFVEKSALDELLKPVG